MQERWVPANPRSHAHFQNNTQKASNRVLTVSDCWHGREFSIDVLYVTRASICVELWTNEGSYRMLVPMSYITCLDISGSSHGKRIGRFLLVAVCT